MPTKLQISLTLALELNLVSNHCPTPLAEVSGGSSGVLVIQDSEDDAMI